MAAAWRVLKPGLGAPKSSVPGLRDRVLPTGLSSPECRGSSTGAARPGDCSASPLPAAAPARAAGPGRGSEGGPGPAPPARPLLLALSLALPGVRTLRDPRGTAVLSARQPARAARPRPLPLPETGFGAARGSSGYRGGRDSTTEGGSSRREVVAAARRWGPGGGGRDAPSSCSSSRRRRRPPECGRGLRGMSVQCGRERRLLPSAPPLSFSCRPARKPGAPARAR